MNILTATDWRPEVAEVWCLAVSATLQTPHTATVLWHSKLPGCGCATRQIPQAGAVVSMFALERYAPRAGTAMFLEEDMIPVLPWSVDDYPGSLLYAEGSPGRPWPALTLRRQGGPPGARLVPQRFVRDGGCPDWLPSELCEPALRANAKVLGRHFLHLDKMYRRGVPEAEAKNELLAMLRQRFSGEPVAPQPHGLGDYVAAGLSAIGITPERVSATLGVKDCGCKKRQAKLNELGRKFGIG